MEIVILNASPRWHGNISQMLNVVRETAESRIHQRYQENQNQQFHQKVYGFLL